MSIIDAILQYSTEKNCFIKVPQTWLSRNEECQVFLVSSDSCKLYVSCLKSLLSSQKNHVFLNQKFAKKHHLKNNDQVWIQKVGGRIPTADKVMLEPILSDDSQILELNASHIENVLLDQIRVVFPDEEFPLWVNQVSFYVKVLDIEPKVNVAYLTEETAVHVKLHGNISEKVQRLNKKPDHLQFDFLRMKSDVELNFEITEDDKNYRLFSWFSSEDKTYKKKFGTKIHDNFVPLNFEASLRVVPFEHSQKQDLPEIMQSTIVFINASTYADISDVSEIPPCFVAVLQKLPFPLDKKKTKDTEANSAKSEKELDSASKSNADTRQSERKPLSDTSPRDKRKSTFDSVCVIVMVMQSIEEDEFGLPMSFFYTKNLILVPKKLRMALNLKVSTLTHIKAVSNTPVPLNMLVLHPATPLSYDISKEISERFRVWFENNMCQNVKESSIFVLSEGTLIRLLCSGYERDFFISFESNYELSPHISSDDSSLKQKRLNKEPAYCYINYKYMLSLCTNNRLKIGEPMCFSLSVDRPYLNKPDGLYQHIYGLSLEDLGGVTELANRALQDIEFWLKLRPVSCISYLPFTFHGCILMCGPKGVGKTTLTKALCKVLIKEPYHVFVQIINCLPLKGKRVDTISKIWDDDTSEALYYQPSVIVFENLDCIASCAASYEQEISPEGIYAANIVQTFLHLLNRIFRSDGKIVVIVTAQSTHSLHPAIMRTKGRHVFDSIIEIQPPSPEQREDILCSLIRSKPHVISTNVTHIPWPKIAQRTEGFVAQDLDMLVDRATHAAWVRMGSEILLTKLTNTESPEVALCLEDFEKALEGYVPSSLRDIPLQVQDQKGWSDVGGLKEVKKVVQQIITWPIKYKQLFKDYSLKRQTNILLYGAPGTGKTLLAGVIANKCGLNFISIKGPELLSKYIGASEQAVRDVFKRASAARPCILFFDEFDSIAPRRGHDSTGVTDRVVNQLLTQLDGVETLEGVHVIAATNRPELIDPALLRPGRLDKCLLCPLPNEEEREEILLCLSSKLPMEEVDFKSIASKTEHFSGADLQALLYTAHLKALHETESFATRRYSRGAAEREYSASSGKIIYMHTVEAGLTAPSQEEGKKIVQDVDIIKENYLGVMKQQPRRHSAMLNVHISQRHLDDAASEMKPSVSEEEMKRYETVFKNFSNSLSGDSSASIAESIRKIAKRQTLA
ncbi:Peroxisome biogenesis factor 1, partial [Stegodyphus mimosarum]